MPYSLTGSRLASSGTHVAFMYLLPSPNSIGAPPPPELWYTPKDRKMSFLEGGYIYAAPAILVPLSDPINAKL